MKERPILFSGEMVRAILDDRKTQTRRVVKNQPSEDVNDGRWYADRYNGGPQWCWWGKPGTDVHNKVAHHIGQVCPYGKPGDRLWVRERHARTDAITTIPHYFADGPLPSISYRHDVSLLQSYPSIHMPRWASRITLEIVNVRVERVQEITEDDAKSEGAPVGFRTVIPVDGKPVGATKPYTIPSSYIGGFANLWDSINAKRGYGWDFNPWVWVIEFRRIK